MLGHSMAEKVTPSNSRFIIRSLFVINFLLTIWCFYSSFYIFSLKTRTTKFPDIIFYFPESSKYRFQFISILPMVCRFS